MSGPDPLVPVRLLGDVRAWALSHPSFFFADGVPSAAALVEMLVAGARALGADGIEATECGEWFIVAARNDWFAQARIALPALDPLTALAAFPELGQNCVRPECLVVAFAADVVMRGSQGAQVVRGTVDDGDAIWAAGDNGWARVVAFRGVMGAPER